MDIRKNIDGRLALSVLVLLSGYVGSLFVVRGIWPDYVLPGALVGVVVGPMLVALHLNIRNESRTGAAKQPTITSEGVYEDLYTGWLGVVFLSVIAATIATIALFIWLFPPVLPLFAVGLFFTYALGRFINARKRKHP